MAGIATLKALTDAGWHVKLMSDHDLKPTPTWRVWLRWPKGPPPHKEESTRVDTVPQAIAWAEETAKGWHFE